MTVQVVKDEERNKSMKIYLSGLTTISVVVMTLSYLYSWGFWGWFAGVFLLMAGAGGLAGMLKTGGAGKYTCAHCGHVNSILHISEERVEACENCHTYYEGAATMEMVARDAIKEEAVFSVGLPEHFHWPEGCPVCRGTVTRHIQLEGVDALGSVAANAAPISYQRKSQIDAPACDLHDDGVFLSRRGSETVIYFRSHDYWRAFCEINQIGPYTRVE